VRNPSSYKASKRGEFIVALRFMFSQRQASAKPKRLEGIVRVNIAPKKPHGRNVNEKQEASPSRGPGTHVSRLSRVLHD
jgi:hypothetical protein